MKSLSKKERKGRRIRKVGGRLKNILSKQNIHLRKKRKKEEKLGIFFLPKKENINLP